jgi:threonine dehydratase
LPEAVAGILPSYADVEAAAARLAGHAERTPVRTCAALDAHTGARVFLKCENSQRTGSFKFRGAFNALARIEARERPRAVVAFSSGNHAQAVALAARLLGMSATIVMPADAPATKMQATREQGAHVVTYDRYREDREAIATRLAADAGAVLLPPFDHADIIAGQGTVACELLEEVGSLDAMYVCLGGGGLLSGTLLAAGALAPACRVFGVEPQAGNDGQRSLRSGALVRIEVPRTIADGAQTQSLGRLTFEVIRRGVTDIVTVSDAELVAAMRFLDRELGIVAEPTGCLGLAAVLAAGERLACQRVGVILSGGNIEAARFAALTQG